MSPRKDAATVGAVGARSQAVEAATGRGTDQPTRPVACIPEELHGDGAVPPLPLRDERRACCVEELLPALACEAAA